MMKYYYADVMSDGRVRACFCYEGPDEGPLEPHWESQAEGVVVLLDGPIDWRGPSETSVLYMIDGVLEWRESLPLAGGIARAIEQIDGAADAARMMVIARQTNTPEYQRAEAQARAFKAAGYPADDVPRNVAGWVAAKWREGWTAQQSADDIIATADRWYELLDDIRDMRLAAKEDVRHAADATEVAARVQQFDVDLSNLMTGAE